VADFRLQIYDLYCKPYRLSPLGRGQKELEVNEMIMGWVVEYGYVAQVCDATAAK
jgi:hypothetical protein